MNDKMEETEGTYTAFTTGSMFASDTCGSPTCNFIFGLAPSFKPGHPCETKIPSLFECYMCPYFRGGCYTVVTTMDIGINELYVG